MEKEEIHNEKYNCNCDEKCECNEKCECEDCNCDESCECKDHECKCGENCECDPCNCNELDHKQKHEKHDNKKIKKLENKIDELEKKLKESEEKSLIAKADLVNYRKRKDEDVMRIMKYANEDIIREILPIVDNFERAIKLDDDNLDDELSKFLQGFKMIYCNLISVLEKNEVKQIDGANKPFDPTYHQAVMTEASDKEKDIVLEVLQKGYLYKDKVIRPAMVKVSE